MRVLIADKDPYDLDAYRTALEAPDVRVITTNDGKELERLAREQLPDVVVASSSLGQMGGLAACRDLKTLALLGSIPEPKVLVLLERDADGWLASWSQADRWLTKPFDMGELERVVREMVAPRPASQL